MKDLDPNKTNEANETNELNEATEEEFDVNASHDDWDFFAAI